MHAHIYTRAPIYVSLKFEDWDGWLFFSFCMMLVLIPKAAETLIWAEPWPPKETTLEGAVLPRCRSWVFLLKTVINQIGLGCQSMPGTPVDKDDCSTK